MNPRDVKTNDDAKQIVQQRGLRHVKVGLFDVDGVMRGKYMSREKFFSALDNGFGFCDVVLGWGLQRSTLRKCRREIHRLAHRLPGCPCENPTPVLSLHSI